LSVDVVAVLTPLLHNLVAMIGGAADKPLLVATITFSVVAVLLFILLYNVHQVILLPPYKEKCLK